MTCQTILERLPLLDDPELGEDERTALLDHVEQCPQCAHEVDLLRESQRLLWSLRQVKVPVHGVHRVLDGISESNARARQTTNTRIRFRWGHPTRVGSMVLGAIAAVFLILLPALRQDDTMLSTHHAPPEVASSLVEGSPRSISLFSADETAELSPRTSLRVDVTTEDPASTERRLTHLAEQGGIHWEIIHGHVDQPAVEIALMNASAPDIVHLLSVLEQEEAALVSSDAMDTLLAAEARQDPTIDVMISIRSP